MSYPLGQEGPALSENVSVVETRSALAAMIQTAATTVNEKSHNDHLDPEKRRRNVEVRGFGHGCNGTTLDLQMTLTMTALMPTKRYGEGKISC